MNEFSNILLSLPRSSRRNIAIITDICLCLICTWIAFIIRLEELILFKDFNIFSALISVIIAVPIFWLFGLYRLLIRFAGLSYYLQSFNVYPSLWADLFFSNRCLWN